MKCNIYLYIDDIRPCPRDLFNSFVVFTARDYYSAIDILDFYSNTDANIFVDFDHDLGVGKNGYDISKYIVENQIPISGYTVHSMNPVGAFNIKQLLDRYGYDYFV